MSKEEKDQFLLKQTAKANLSKLQGGITIEQFQCMVTTVSAVEETEEAEARWMDYWMKHMDGIKGLPDEPSDKLIDILYRAKNIENIMDMSVQEVLQIPEEKLELY